MLAITEGTTGKKRASTSVDLLVSQRIRLRRNVLRVSQEKLAEAIGVTFQQVQKYEKGSNRVSAGKLYDIALALQVPVSFFFEEAEASDEQSEFRALAATSDGIEMLRAFAGIRNRSAREQIIGICKTVANGQASH